MRVESITQSRPTRTPRPMSTHIPRRSRRRLNWLALITLSRSYPHTSANSDQRYIRLTIASADSCHTIITSSVTQIASSAYSTGRPLTLLLAPYPAPSCLLPLPIHAGPSSFVPNPAPSALKRQTVGFFWLAHILNCSLLAFSEFFG
jgi:hypothetical protein